ncbi:MAG TPA: hypothetical protein VIA62_20630 [Thermoanaerobaculia bacterium]|jgi:hypothetical protein|nr:hypothetical protein [Thermoanaerobaculia bacterium]
MGTSSEHSKYPAMIVERVSLPAKPEVGKRYNAAGEEDPEGNVFYEFVGPTAHAWAVFQQDLLPSQSGAMIFENVAGSGILDAIVSQWIRGGSGTLGQNLNQPNAGDAVIVFLARQRAQDRVKVAGLNSSQARVAVAAGLLYIPGIGG